jgi:hypothetical protein
MSEPGGSCGTSARSEYCLLVYTPDERAIRLGWRTLAIDLKGEPLFSKFLARMRWCIDRNRVLFGSMAGAPGSEWRGF